jgi:expansin (peptidoglycan-binding protein)
MNVEQFDSFGQESNGNPICGKKVLITYESNTVEIEITDKCPGCAYGSIDLSPTAFEQLAPESVGRIPITWQFVN